MNLDRLKILCSMAGGHCQNMREVALGWTGLALACGKEPNATCYFGLGFGSLFAKKKGQANEVSGRFKTRSLRRVLRTIIGRA